MLVLDTDHVVEYQKGTSVQSRRLKERLDGSEETFGTTIITVEEVMRGWMAAIRRVHDPLAQIRAYSNLRRLFRFFATWRVLEWDEPAVNQFQSLKQASTKVGTMDLKIASIVLTTGATLLTRNTNDFVRVPGLQIEDWLS